MKQVLTAVFVFGLLGAATAAQAQPAVGVRVGFNSATVHSSDSSGTDFKMKPGLVAGVFVEVPVAPGFAFQPELLFSQEGAKIEDSGDTAKVHLNFVQIPLLAHIKLGKSPAALLVGPSIGVRASAKIKFDGGEEDFKDQVKNICC